MELKNITTRDDMIVSLNTPNGLSAVRIRVLIGATGNVQTLIYPQPFAKVHLEPKQSELANIIRLDPADTDDWPI